MVTLLLQYKSNPNQKDVQGHNALYYAVKSGDQNTIKWLLLNYSIPSYSMLRLTSDEQIVNMLTKALSVSQSLQKLNFSKRHKSWKGEMSKLLGL